MKRRQFLALLGAAGAARLTWPVPADDEEMVFPAPESGLILLDKKDWCEVLAVEVVGMLDKLWQGEAWIGTPTFPSMLRWRVHTGLGYNMLWLPPPEERIVSSTNIVVGATPGIRITATMNDHGVLRQLAYQS